MIYRGYHVLSERIVYRIDAIFTKFRIGKRCGAIISIDKRLCEAVLR